VRDYVHEHFAKHKAGKTGHGCSVVPSIICTDGTKLSVQASRVHYCSPRADEGPWTSVEVFCTVGRKGGRVAIPSFGSGGTEDPYGWVPVDKVNAYIHKHGGLT
jgi:hypothetical protein